MRFTTKLNERARHNVPRIKYNKFVNDTTKLLCEEKKPSSKHPESQATASSYSLRFYYISTRVTLELCKQWTHQPLKESPLAESHKWFHTPVHRPAVYGFMALHLSA